jgi:hypothetical protein
MPSERRLPKRSVAKDGNKSKKPRRGGKAGSKAVHSEPEEGRVLPTEAATVAVPETAATEAVEKEGSLVAPEMVEAEKEGSLAALETAEAEMEKSLAAETETAVETAAETLVMDKEVDAGAFMFFSCAVFFCFFVILLINFITHLYNDCMYGL